MAWVTVIAIILGPILAVQAQRIVEILRDRKTRRLNVFKRLMATRGAPLSWPHVEALNSIELEFSGGGQRDINVRQRWNAYHDHLNSLNPDPRQAQEQLPRWTERKDELLGELLVEMGGAVGHANLDPVHIRRGIYTPRGHADFETETQILRRLLIEVLLGQRNLPLDVRSVPRADQPQPQARIDPELEDATRRLREIQNRETPEHPPRH